MKSLPLEREEIKFITLSLERGEGWERVTES